MLLVTVLLFSACTSEGEKQQTSNGEEKAEDSNFNEEGYPIVKDKITLKLFGPKNMVHSDWATMDFFKAMEEKTNISFEFDTPPSGDAFMEKKNLLVASGELPDIFFAAQLSAEDEVNYGSQGIIIPLEGLIEKYAPNLSALLQDPVIKSSITATDDHIYALPQLTETYLNYPKIWINTTWLDRLGLQMPTTVEEFYNALVAIKNGDPNGNGKADEIPITDVGGVDEVKHTILAAFGLLNGQYGAEVGVENDTAFFAPTDPRYKAYLEFMNRLYSEGLLDAETFSQTSQQWVAKGNEGRYGSLATAGAFLVVGNERNFDYDVLPPLTSSLNDKKLQLKTPTIIRGTFAISSSDPYPEATIRWVDYLYSQEGTVLLSEGIEGVHWYEAEGGGIKYNIPEGMDVQMWRGSISPDPGEVTPKDFREHFARMSAFEEKTNPMNFHITSETNEKLKPFAQIGFPQVYFTNEEQQELNVLSADIRIYVKQMEAKFVTGETSMNEWDNYVNILKKMKVDHFVKIYQQAYDRWKAAQ
ncbi:extracellular solute-binding protein [Cohnella zeiphila]|uniref:Extracellular solute-binding protein n=1 Tax=Cohnella zeiphila TaxID=2761120 RepID=A0A7X0VUF4_9BACL|nr:extracellular solute-binding protein [Cohnella zeiphila]MBB6730881.1 extracellular solute-binding protein [Cohnella zeiphila]